MSNEVEEDKSLYIKRAESMLIAVAVNHLHSTYDAEQKRLRTEFFNLPANKVFRTWEWLSDGSKLRVLNAKRALFDQFAEEIMKKEQADENS